MRCLRESAVIFVINIVHYSVHPPPHTKQVLESIPRYRSPREPADIMLGFNHRLSVCCGRPLRRRVVSTMLAVSGNLSQTSEQQIDTSATYIIRFTGPPYDRRGAQLARRRIIHAYLCLIKCPAAVPTSRVQTPSYSRQRKVDISLN